jgi:hypothetical protein
MFERFRFRRILTVASCFLIALALGLRIGIGAILAAALLAWAFADGLAGFRDPYVVAIGLGVCVFAVGVIVIVFAARRRFLMELLAVSVGLYIGASLSLSSGLSNLAQDEVARTHNGSIQQYVHPVLQPARATVTTGHVPYVASRVTSLVVATPAPIFLGMARVVPAPPVAAVRVYSNGSLGVHGLEKEDSDSGLQDIVPENSGAGWLFFVQSRRDGGVTSAVADEPDGTVFIVGPDCAGNEGCNRSYCRIDASQCNTTFGRIAGDESRTFMQPKGEGNGLVDLARVVPGRSGDLWFYDRLHDSVMRVTSNGRTYLVYRVPVSQDDDSTIRTSIFSERDAIWINDIKDRSLLMVPTDGGAIRDLVYPRGRYQWLLMRLLAGDATGIWLASTDGVWWYGIDGAVKHFDSPTVRNLDRFVTMTLDHRLLLRVERPGSLQFVEISPSGDAVYHNVPPEADTAIAAGIAKFDNGDLFYGRLATQADQLERVDHKGHQWIVDVAPQRL